MQNWLFRLLTISSVSTVFLTSCSDQSNIMNNSDDDKKFKVGLITNATGIDDKSFNESIWSAIKKYGMKHDWKEKKNYQFKNATSIKEKEKFLTQYSKENDLTIGAGLPFKEPLSKVSNQNKKADFAIIDGIVEKPNVVSITYHEEQAAFLAGVAAAMSTKSLKIGFIGGPKNEITEKFDYGFQAGIKSVDPKIKVKSKYATTFNDPNEGSKLAKSLYDGGADIIFQAAGKTGLGVFSVAKQLKKSGKNVWVIGVDRDQYKEGLPENVTLTSAIKRIDKGVKEVLNKKRKGNFQGGRILRLGIKEGGVGLPKENKNFNKDINKQIDLYKSNIRSGNIEVPKTKVEFDKFTPKEPKKEEKKKKKIKMTK